MTSSASNTPTPVTPRVRRFYVNLHCKPNDLWGTVEVISTGRQAAAELARRQFFRGGGWAVVEVREITKDYERFEGGSRVSAASNGGGNREARATPSPPHAQQREFGT